MKKTKHILLCITTILIIIVAIFCIKKYYPAKQKNVEIVSNSNFEENNIEVAEYKSVNNKAENKYVNNKKDINKKKNNKIEELINISNCTEEFMKEYYKGVQEIQNTNNKENVVIVISKSDIENTYGATKIVKAPNNQYLLQYKNEKEQ